MRVPLLALLVVSVQLVSAQKPLTRIYSPDKKIQAEIMLTSDGEPVYTLKYGGKGVLNSSRLGIEMEGEDFSKGLEFVKVSASERVKDAYKSLNAKKSEVRPEADKVTLHFKNAAGRSMEIIFRLSNDGAAFRYHFPDRSVGKRIIKQELTSFNFPETARAWLQPMQAAKTGWEQTNPAYEEHYQMDIPAGTPSPLKAGWVYPALFRSNDVWVLITEASLDSNYCATRLRTGPKGEYTIGFPDPREIIPGQGLLPQAAGAFYSPWRIITVGSLKTIAESTLGTDLAEPAAAMDWSFVKPGKSSWSWINSKDDFIIYDEQKKYIDFAAQMNWQYCLIDVNWDTKIGYDRMKELAGYAASKNVGLLLWYNSAGSWNTVKYTPKGKLLTAESREKEFRRLNEMGIKGVKIDFFAGDGRSVIKYYLDILKDAARHKLLVNFHGATLPRGWQRTYPNLMTVEAVRGFEMVTFGQQDADAEASHSTMLPFTRNAFDPMDFTPMNLYKIPTSVQRKTTSAFELATAVLFLSGIQHYAESPEGMKHVPEYVQRFLRELPSHWDDVRFIEGYPGKYVVLARRSGDKWYICGINGENTEKTIRLDLASFNKKSASFITDGTDSLFQQEALLLNNEKSRQITMKPNGGFAAVLE